MESYLSFSDDAVLDGATSLEGSMEDVTRETIPRDTPPTSTSTPTEEEPTEWPAPLEAATKEAAPAGKPLKGPTHLLVAADDPAEGLTALQAQHKKQRKMEAPHSGYPAWTKVLHPPQLVTTAEQIPLDLGGLKGRHCSWSAGGRRAWCQRVEECLQTAELHPMSPTKSPKPVQEITLPPGFMGVVACLQRDPLPMTTIKAPMEPTQPEIMVEPVIATMCTSYIVQDETTGVTYMDMVTTFMGRVALSSSHVATCSSRPTIEDVTNLP